MDSIATLTPESLVLAVVDQLRPIIERAIADAVSQARTPPVIDAPAAMSLGGLSRSMLDRLTARGVFTDARPPEKRIAGSPRRYDPAEIVAYREEGEAGVKRIRKLLRR